MRKGLRVIIDRKSTRLNSSHANISYAVFCLKKTFDRDDLLDLYALRALLEPHAAALAARRIEAADVDRLAELCEADDLIVANEAFHRIILEAAGSSFFSIETPPP